MPLGNNIGGYQYHHKCFDLNHFETFMTRIRMEWTFETVTKKNALSKTNKQRNKRSPQ